MRVLQIGSDRSKRGILFPGSPGYERQCAYATVFGALDIIGFSRSGDGARATERAELRIFPTNSASALFYGFDAIRIARRLPAPDVVSSQDPFEAGLVAWIIARMKGAPLYVQVHTDFLSPEYMRHSLINRVRVLLAGFVLARASRIRVVSERVKKGIQDRYHPRAPISVLPIFVDIEKFKQAQNDSALIERFAFFKTKLLVVVRLEPEKNIELAIAAFAKSAPKDACLVVVGQGSALVRLQALARTLSVSDRVFFEGTHDTAPYYALADLVLVPSKYEGYGLVIIEALAAGKPVLSTDVGVAREAGAIVANPEQFPDALAQWFKSGPRTGTLRAYPYANFDEYVRACRADLMACIANK